MRTCCSQLGFLTSLVGFVGLALAAPTASCGGTAGKADANAPRSASASPGKETSGGSQGSAVADAAPPPRPFAGSAADATQLIGVAVEKKSAEILKCVAEYRSRKKLPHERVTIAMGIDQEGRLLGASLPKGNTDPTLSECVQRALADAPFPSSHAGVISITKTYEEIVQ